jgi:hypothetical protein
LTHWVIPARISQWQDQPTSGDPIMTELHPFAIAVFTLGSNKAPRNKRTVRGIAYQNEGMEARFESPKVPGITFHFDNPNGICAPGMTAEVKAVVNLKERTATFHSEID